MWVSPYSGPMRSSALLVPLSFLVAMAAACSSTNTIIHQSAPAEDAGDDTDSGVIDVVDAGVSNDAGKKDAGFVPASKDPQAVPQVAYNGGALLLSPTMVSVTFDSDNLRSQIETFDDTISSSPWWDTVRAGFCDANNKCIGQGTAGAHVHLQSGSQLANYTDSAGGGASTIQSMITGYIMNVTFPAPTANSLYMIYFTSVATISLDGTPSCMGFGAYHNSMKYNGTQFAYAIMPRCSGDFNYLTNAASHELAEAATDPFISTDPNNPYTGYGSFVDAWDVPWGGEVGDRCFDGFGQSEDIYQQGAYQVQRVWNNKAATAGHDPCVPAPSPSTTPYFNMAPRATDGDILTLAVGSTVSVPVQPISDGLMPTSQIAYDAIEITATTGKGSDVLTLSGGGALIMGEQGSVSVTLKGTPTKGLAIFVVRSQRIDTAGKAVGAIHYWPFIVQPK